MTWKTTIVLLAIAIAGGTYVKLYEIKRPDTAEAKRRAQNVVNFNPEKINGIVIWNGDDMINMRRDNNKWRLDAPIKDQADNALIDNLLSQLEAWQKDADRKSTRLNSSHLVISYAVFCLQKKHTQ